MKGGMCQGPAIITCHHYPRVASVLLLKCVKSE